MGSCCTGPQTLMVAVVASRVFLYAFDVAYVELQQQLVAEGLRTEKSPDERGRGRAAPDAGLDVAFPRQELGSLDARRRQRVAAKVSVRLPELPGRVVVEKTSGRARRGERNVLGPGSVDVRPDESWERGIENPGSYKLDRLGL